MTANFFQYSMENKGLNFTTQAVLVLALHIVLGRIYYKGLNFTTQAVLKYWLCTWNSYGFSETETQISRGHGGRFRTALLYSRSRQAQAYLEHSVKTSDLSMISPFSSIKAVASRQAPQATTGTRLKIHQELWVNWKRVQA